MEGLLFGIVDNGVLIFGAYSGLDIGERLAKGRGALGAVLGAGIGNAVSDAAGAATDPAMHGMIMGVTVGCLIALTVVPVIEWIKRSK
jgi:hypothetical protein